MDEDPAFVEDEALPAEGEEERRRLRVAGLAFLGVLALLAVAFGISQIRIVPEITGLTRDAAEARLRSARLPAEGHPVFRGDPGQRRRLGVVAQAPGRGGLSFGANVVRYDYIAGPARVRVPECVGKPVAEAVEVVESAALTVPEEDYGTDPHRRRVASQEPSGGTLAARGATVRITTGFDDDGAGWKHQEAVWHRGAEPCFACHDPVFCADCHVKESVRETSF